MFKAMIKLIGIIFCLVCCIPSIAHPSWGLSMDQERNLYIPDIARNGRGTLWKLTPERQLIPLMKNFHCHNVNVLPNGDLYAAHGEGNHTLIRWSNEDIDTIVHETNFDLFFGGNCVVSPNGNIYYSINHYIWQKFPDGRIEKANDQYLEWNQAIYVDEDECIYIPDIGIEEGVLYRLSPGGNAEKIATHLVSRLDRPRDKHNDVLLGMTKDNHGNIYIAESAGQRVIQIDASGQKQTFYQSEQGWYPVGICFQNDTVFMTEYHQSSIEMTRVIQIEPGKKPHVYFEFP